MKRIHIGLDVQDLDRSISFYANLFGAEPSLRRDDYAKWMLEDPRVNFSITARGSKRSDVHFGIQVEDPADLSEMAGRLKSAGETVLDEPDTTCCYHKSEKAWVLDPENFRWETFFTSGVATEFGESAAAIDELRASRLSHESNGKTKACCSPE